MNMDPHNILKYPVNTEKAVRLMELENKLIFIVDLKSTKKEIKDSFEKLFKLKVKKVNTMLTPQGKKKAYILLNKETPAVDVMTQLGLV